MKIGSILTLFAIISLAPAHAIEMKRVQEKIASAKLQGHELVAIFDLDETTIRSTERRLTAYKIALSENVHLFAKRFPKELDVTMKAFKTATIAIFPKENEYSSELLYKKLGINNLEFTKILDTAMVSHYLNDGELIALDHPVQGTIRFLNQLYQQGAKVYFVSSRYKDTQLEDTLVNLSHYRLYRSGQSKLLLRNRGEASVDFKARTFLEIKNSLKHNQEVILVGENEPENLNLMQEQFPEALAIFRIGAVMNTTVAIKNPENVLFFASFVHEN